MSSAEAAVEVQSLSHTYADGTQALREVSFRMSAGESVALFGRNGSGKTTFILHLNGLLLPQRGTVRVGGLAVTKANLSAVRRSVGLVFQDADDQLFMSTVLEDVAFGLRNTGAAESEAAARAREVLAELGMTAGLDRAPWHLSLGEKRRVALAGVLAMRPALIVLDEPTTFLDPPGREELGTSLNHLPQAKVIVTHDAGFARRTASRAVFFERGRIVGDGSVEEILRRYDWDR
ncbi:MAG: energy-coupling factor ABC transporter ATP-binding protein [Bryobacteraceae bacterium]|nr:energy-coupling factor ABC transporter ATP-binding protein [Bryobacteraceae bacterium]